MREREAKGPREPQEGTHLSVGSGEAAWKRQCKQGLEGVNEAGYVCL